VQASIAANTWVVSGAPETKSNPLPSLQFNPTLICLPASYTSVVVLDINSVMDCKNATANPFHHVASISFVKTFIIVNTMAVSVVIPLAYPK
jgi:hypothetical protein